MQMDALNRANVLWDLAAGLFQLASYFSYKVNVAKPIVVASGKKINVVTAKGGRGVESRFHIVSAVDVIDSDAPLIRSFIPPHYVIETEGHWRRLQEDKYGRGPNGERSLGRTWVKVQSDWRRRPPKPRTIYVKSLVSKAKSFANELMQAAVEATDAPHSSSSKTDAGVLYVLRCTAMSEAVYKIGWTSGTAEERAIQLSSATGVPTSFVVVDSWKHGDPEGLEQGVHAMLAPYRLNENREFFQVEYEKIKAIVESEIGRTT